jgi:hypothetical protein
VGREQGDQRSDTREDGPGKRDHPHDHRSSETVQPIVDLIELAIDPVKPAIHPVKPAIDLVKSPIDLDETSIDVIKPFVDLLEPLVGLLFHPVEPLVGLLFDPVEPFVDPDREFVQSTIDHSAIAASVRLVVATSMKWRLRREIAFPNERTCRFCV